MRTKLPLLLIVAKDYNPSTNRIHHIPVAKDHYATEDAPAVDCVQVVKNKIHNACQAAKERTTYLIHIWCSLFFLEVNIESLICMYFFYLSFSRKKLFCIYFFSCPSLLIWKILTCLKSNTCLIVVSFDKISVYSSPPLTDSTPDEFHAKQKDLRSWKRYWSG